jgi:cellobiose phosphorylase
MSQKYGHFSEDGSEFIITTPNTPRPWVNYLTNGDYAALCSNIGGGFSFYLDHRFHSILRRGAYQHLEDMPARLIYIKDEDTGETWTANVQPSGKFDAYEARHGMGYTTITSRYRSIGANVSYFVPPAINAELWDVALTNHGTGVRRLSVYSFADFVLGNVSLDENESQILALFNDLTVGEQDIRFRRTWWHARIGWAEERGQWPYRVFLTTTVKPVKMCADRNAFFGPFRNFSNPAALDGAILPDANPAGKDLVGVCQWRVTLRPGETWTTHLAIGIQDNRDTPANSKQIRDLQHPKTYERAWKATRDHWSKLFAPVQVQTPDDDINRMINHWNKYQLMVNFHFGRGPSYYHKGQYPAMRDSCQDAFGVIPLSPTLAKTNLKRIARFFFKDGRACGGCNRVGIPEGPSEKVDLPLWFVLAVADYLRETGDFAFLDESFPLMDGGASTVYQKLVTGIDRMLEDRGKRGLPLIGKGDWNDAANRIGVKGKGESVWLAQFLVFVIDEIAPFLERRGDTKRLKTYRRRSDQIKKIVNEKCWDGAWFVRAFKDDGTPVGVKGQKEGCIWINSQTWAVIAKISDEARLNQCMDSAEKLLGTEYGMMNLAPAFTKVDDSIGLITSFRRGWKENAAVFSHASSFNVVARAMLGRGKDAVDLFRRILPMRKDSDTYLIEPYVYAQFCVGPSSVGEFGRGSYHWLTGTAAWMFRAMTDYILGVHPTLAGLRLQPAVDPTWRNFSMTRTFRKAVYHIEFSNPDGVETGIREIRLDGKPIAGDVLPLPTAKNHHVTVVMGRA